MSGSRVSQDSTSFWATASSTKTTTDAGPANTLTETSTAVTTNVEGTVEQQQEVDMSSQAVGAETYGEATSPVSGEKQVCMSYGYWMNLSVAGVNPGT